MMATLQLYERRRSEYWTAWRWTDTSYGRFPVWIWPYPCVLGNGGQHLTYSFGQQVMKLIASAAELTEAPSQADSFGTPNGISSNLHSLTERKGGSRERGKSSGICADLSRHALTAIRFRYGR